MCLSVVLLGFLSPSFIIYTKEVSERKSYNFSIIMQQQRPISKNCQFRKVTNKFLHNIIPIGFFIALKWVNFFSLLKWGKDRESLSGKSKKKLLRLPKKLFQTDFFVYFFQARLSVSKFTLDTVALAVTSEIACRFECWTSLNCPINDSQDS